MARVLITGGAGFIGSHVADVLLAAGYEVRLLDNLSTQVHGTSRTAPTYLNREAELMIGDVTDPIAVGRALRGAGKQAIGSLQGDVAEWLKAAVC